MIKIVNKELLIKYCNILFEVYPLITAVVFMIGYFSDILEYCLYGILLVVLLNIVSSMFDLKNKILLLLYSITYFTLLLGRRTIYLFSGIPWHSSNDPTIEKNSLLLLFLSIFFVAVGVNLCIHIIRKKNNARVIFDLSSNQKKLIQIIFFCIFVVTLIPSCAQNIEKILFVNQNNYAAIHSSFSSNIPFFLQKIANMNITFYYLTLATLPNKRLTFATILLCLINSTLTLIYGGRGPLVVNLLVLIFYLAYRQHFLKEKYFTKKTVTVFTVLGIIFISFLGSYNYTRNDQEFDANPLESIKQLFIDQSISSEIITYVQEYQAELPETNENYTFGNVINIISGNDYYIENTNTVKTALYGNNLGATLSYLILGDSFIRGHGLGTQYIAELYVDFSYLGVISYSLILGIVLCLISNINKNRIICLAAGLALISNLLYLPRQFAMGWLTYFLSITTIGSFILAILVIIIVRRCSNENNVDC